jgi:hypothetical protein
MPNTSGQTVSVTNNSQNISGFDLLYDSKEEFIGYYNGQEFGYNFKIYGPRSPSVGKSENYEIFIQPAGDRNIAIGSFLVAYPDDRVNILPIILEYKTNKGIWRDVDIARDFNESEFYNWFLDVGMGVNLKVPGLWALIKKAITIPWPMPDTDSAFADNNAYDSFGLKFESFNSTWETYTEGGNTPHLGVHVTIPLEFTQPGVTDLHFFLVAKYYDEEDFTTTGPIVIHVTPVCVVNGSQAIPTTTINQSIQPLVWSDKNEYNSSEEIVIHYQTNVDAARRIIIRSASGTKSPINPIVIGENLFPHQLNGSKKILVNDTGNYEVVFKAWTINSSEEASSVFTVGKNVSQDKFNGQIIDVIWPTKDTYNHTEPIPVDVDFENTGSEARSFWVGYSVQDSSGKWWDAPAQQAAVTQAGENSSLELKWLPLNEAPDGAYNATVALWDARNSTTGLMEGEFDRMTKSNAFQLNLIPATNVPQNEALGGWNRTFGGSGSDYGASVQQTSDGGYIIAGSSAGTSSSNVCLVKTDTDGNSLWDKTFGGPGNDYGASVQQTSDGGYIIAGSTDSYGAGSSDIWLVKTDADGNSLWDKTFG